MQEKQFSGWEANLDEMCGGAQTAAPAHPGKTVDCLGEGSLSGSTLRDACMLRVSILPALKKEGRHAFCRQNDQEHHKAGFPQRLSVGGYSINIHSFGLPEFEEGWVSELQDGRGRKTQRAANSEVQQLSAPGVGWEWGWRCGGGWGRLSTLSIKSLYRKQVFHLLGYMQGFVQQKARMECGLPPINNGWTEV